MAAAAAASGGGGGGGGFGTTAAAILVGVVAVVGLVALVGVVKFCRKTKRSPSAHAYGGGDGVDQAQSSAFSIQSQTSVLSTAE